MRGSHHGEILTPHLNPLPTGEGIRPSSSWYICRQQGQLLVAEWSGSGAHPMTSSPRVLAGSVAHVSRGGQQLPIDHGADEFRVIDHCKMCALAHVHLQARIGETAPAEG